MRYFSSTATRTTLAGSVTAGATTIVVASVSGFPATRPYSLILDFDTINEEIVTVTAASGTTLTVTRGEDGTSAIAHDLGSVVVHGFTGRDLGEPQAHMAATSEHGASGDLVGEDNTQTLTNKTIDGVDNTFTNIPQSAVTSLTTDLGLKAPLADPTFTGTVSLPSTTSIGDVDSTEIGYVNGVTSNIQAQLDANTAADALKAPLASPTFTGDVVLPSTTTIGSVTGTEVAYLSGVTSNLQTQITSITGGGTSVPAGGATDEILVKLSGTDYDMAWKSMAELSYVPGASGNYVVADGAITGGDSTGTYSVGAYTYKYHVFSSTDVTMYLEVATAVIGDVLMVGAGGGGGNGALSYGSGGGGGGAVYALPYAWGAGSHSLWVGSGGTANAVGGDTYLEGFVGTITGTTLIAYGGGYGGNGNQGSPGQDGGDGGSGGGAGEGAGGVPGASGSALYGTLDGGSTTNDQLFRATNGASGAGGGASGTSKTGFSSDITGSTVEYGGGGNGYPSYGGGAGGGNSYSANTGGGGNGVGSIAGGGAGQDGVIIARYRIA